MKKISAFFLGILIVATLTSCSFFGKKEEKKEKPATSMAVEFVKKAKEKIKEIKKENLKEENKAGEKEESITLTDKDFDAYLKSLDLAIEKMEEQNKKLKEKMKDGKLSAMDILSFSLNSLGTVFNPDAYLENIAKTEEEKEHYEYAFRKIVQMYSFIGEKDVDQFKKENEENAKEAEKHLKEMQEKIKEIKKKNPELAKEMEDNMSIADLKAIENMANPVKTFSESELALYKKYQKDICAKNNALKEQLKNLRDIFENFKNNN